jgi:hypothetical protein
MSLDGFLQIAKGDVTQLTYFGAMLFSRGVSGTRYKRKKERKNDTNKPQLTQNFLLNFFGFSL